MSTIVFARNAFHRETAKAIEFAAQWLTDFGHEVRIYSDSNEALEAILASGQPPDVLFADQLMPGCDGYDLAVRVHQAFPETELKVILAPAMGSNGDPFYRWPLPIASFVAIPYSPWQVIFSVEQVLCRQITTNPTATAEWDRQDKLRLRKL